MQNLQIQMVTAVILIDNDSNRILAKYFHPEHQDPKQVNPPKHPFATLKEQRAFEAAIWEKTRKQSGPSRQSGRTSRDEAQTRTDSPLDRDRTGDILLYDNSLVLYKQAVDLTFYVIGPAGENELMLSSVLGAFYDAVALLLRHQVEKRAILENLDLVVLALDETIDNGCVLRPGGRQAKARPAATQVQLGGN